MVRSLMALVPIGYILPRRPPVPKGMIGPKDVVQGFPLAGGHVFGYRGGILGIASAVSQMRTLAAAADEICPVAAAWSS